MARALSASPKIFRRYRNRSSSTQIPNAPPLLDVSESNANEAGIDANIPNAAVAGSNRRQSKFAQFLSNPPHIVQERLEYLRIYRKSRGRSVRRKITQGRNSLASLLTSVYKFSNRLIMQIY